MYSTLTKYFKDDDLFIMTGVAKMLGKSKPMARKMEDDWFQGALQNHKTPHKAFQGLRLGENFDANVILQSDLVDVWIKYLEAFNKRFPHEKTTMLETFMKSFGDTEVRKMIETAEKQGWPRNLAAELESTQLKLWLGSEKTIDNVFKLLQLNKNAVSSRVRDVPYFNTWVSYIDNYIKAKPEEKLRFKDGLLNTILNKVKNYPSMESTATSIQMDVMAKYLANNESPRVVFQIFGLEREGNNILGSPFFQSWMRYLEIFNKRNPTQQESWFNSLHMNREFGMIEKAMENPSTVQMAKRVEKEWFSFWLNIKKLPKEVFRSLHLNQVDEKVNTLADPKFEKWTTYLDTFNGRYPDEQTTVIDGLLAYFNDRKLLQMLQTAENDANTKTLATNLQNKLIDKWVAEGVNPEKLQQILSGAQSSKEMIGRYTKKLASINTS
ncbi:RxLR effector protein [Phytophthora megakarya]|uniref:RxLR effector protein n=1 Tax=Phytophthora megakarya TaxID=4795 RepID=A0A225V614_9STRA|nr:RxLR effector protein [Phytophthora megakarya]